MSSTPEEDVVRSLTELLAVAKMAMPDFIFETDPRVYRARQLLAEFAQVSGTRPPSIVREPKPAMVDLGPPPTIAEVERMPGAEPPWDITAGLDAFMASDLAPEIRTEAVVLILRDWLTGHGYMDLLPDDEDRH